jgi:hypothetical protein
MTMPSPSDAEAERRLAALKAGADPTSPELARGAGQDSPPPAGTAGAGRPGDEWADRDPALLGEILEGPETGRGAGRGGPAGEPRGPGVRAVAWGISQAEAGRLGLWIGAGLVAFGAYLVLAELVPGVALVGSLAIASVGGFLVVRHLAGRAGGWALNAGSVLAGYGIARVVADVAGLPAAGWGTLGAGIGLLVVAIRRGWRQEGLGWQAWLGGALGAVIPGFPTMGDLIVPLILVLIGVAVLRRGVRGGQPPQR